MTRDVPPLVGRDWLQEHLDDPCVLPVEVGEDASSYHVAHLPGAVSLDWLEELQEPVQRGFVRQARFEALMDAKGIDRERHLVLYGSDAPVYAASAFWVLRYYQHPRLSLLDGGKAHWLAGGHQMSAALVEPRPGSGYRSPGPDESIRVDRDVLLQTFVGAPPGRAVIDCRTPGEYDGLPAHALDMPLERHRVQGHIPGARNFPSDQLLTADGTLRPVEELREEFAQRGIVSGNSTEIAVYCRVAERSALHWFVLQELLGHPSVRNYDGGWAEYGSLVHAPVAR